jgi:hypothetical protein
MTCDLWLVTCYLLSKEESQSVCPLWELSILSPTGINLGGGGLNMPPDILIHRRTVIQSVVQHKVLLLYRYSYKYMGRTLADTHDLLPSDVWDIFCTWSTENRFYEANTNDEVTHILSFTYNPVDLNNIQQSHFLVGSEPLFYECHCFFWRHVRLELFLYNNYCTRS